MKNPLLILLLLSCLVMAMTAPVSAGYYYFYKDISADDFTVALVYYSNGYKVHNMSEYDCELINHDFVQDLRAYNVVRTDKSLDFKFDCKGWYGIILTIPPLVLPLPYSFTGNMHVVKPRDGLKTPYTLTITDEDEKFTASGENWRLNVSNVYNTRFKVKEGTDYTVDVRASEQSDKTYLYGAIWD